MINAIIDKQIDIGTAALISVICLALVIAILIVIVIVSGLFSKGIIKVDSMENINPKPQNKILEEDEDAVAASVVATIDFYNEFKKDARLVSIEKIDEE